MLKPFGHKANQVLLDISGNQGDGTVRAEAVALSAQSGYLLNAATVSGTGAQGTVLDFTTPVCVITGVLVEAGAPSTHVIVTVEGSLDNVNWYTVLTATTGTGTTPVAKSSGAANVHARYVRANVGTAQSGGTTPTATLMVAGSL